MFAYVTSSKFGHVYFQVGVVLLENPVGSNTITTPTQLLQEVEGLFGQGIKRLYKDKEGQIEVREVSAATSGQVRLSFNTHTLAFLSHFSYKYRGAWLKRSWVLWTFKLRNPFLIIEW